MFHDLTKIFEFKFPYHLNTLLEYVSFGNVTLNSFLVFKFKTLYLNSKWVHIFKFKSYQHHNLNSKQAPSITCILNSKITSYRSYFWIQKPPFNLNTFQPIKTAWIHLLFLTFHKIKIKNRYPQSQNLNSKHNKTFSFKFKNRIFFKFKPHHSITHHNLNSNFSHYFKFKSPT